MGLKPEQIEIAKKFDPAFDGKWKPHDDELGKLKSATWKAEKKLAGVKSAKWFEKSNNIGPKLDKMQSTRTKFDSQINLNNYTSLVKALKDLNAALKAFDGNRQASPDKDKNDIKSLVKGYADTVEGAKTFLENVQQLVVVHYRDMVEAGNIVDSL